MALPIVHKSDRASKIVGRRIKARPKAAIWITTDGHEDFLTPSTVADPQTSDAVTRALAKATTIVAANIRALLTWPTRERLIAISTLAHCKCAEYRLQLEAEASPSLLDVVLSACPAAEDSTVFECWRALAIEVVVISFPLGLEAPCNKLHKAIKVAGIKGFNVAKLLKDAKQLLNEIKKSWSPGAGADRPEVKQLWSDCPWGADLVMPANWNANIEGIPIVGRDGGGMVAPMLIADVRVNTTTREHFVSLAWKTSHKWVSQVVPREMIADTRKIVTLAKFGFPVTSANAAGIVRFLADFENCNSTKFAKSVVTSQLGWIEVAGRQAFLLGNDVLSAARPNADDEEELNVFFRGADDGNDQLADAFGVAGTLDGWVANFLRLTKFPAVAFAITASFAAPLLKITNCGSITTDLAGETTTGKTTVIAFAASVWGNPNPDDPTSLVRTFNSTATYRERSLGVSRDLPAFFDDTQHARDDREVTQFAYVSSQGRGRGRGTVTGIQRQETTRTVTFTTGEKAVTSFTEEGGVYPRILELRNPPFGDRSPQVGSLISELKDGFQHNYGQAGRTFVQNLLDNESKWDTWRERFAESKRQYEQRAGDNMFGRRLAPSLAVIRLAAELVHEALGLAGEVNDPVEPLFDELVSEAGQADRPAAALKVAVEFAMARLGDFAKNGKLSDEHPPRICLGNFDQHSVPVDGQGVQRFRYVQIYPEQLKRILEEASFAWNATLTAR